MVNSAHILCRILLNLISTYSLNSAELCGVGQAHFRGNFELQKMENLLFQTHARRFDLHQTLHVAVVDPLDFIMGVYCVS